MGRVARHGAWRCHLTTDRAERVASGTIYIAQRDMHLIVRGDRQGRHDADPGSRDGRSRPQPQAARATGCVDISLPLEEVGPALVSLVTPTPGDDE